MSERVVHQGPQLRVLAVRLQPPQAEGEPAQPPADAVEGDGLSRQPAAADLHPLPGVVAEAVHVEPLAEVRSQDGLELQAGRGRCALVQALQLAVRVVRVRRWRRVAERLLHPGGYEVPQELGAGEASRGDQAGLGVLRVDLEGAVECLEAVAGVDVLQRVSQASQPQHVAELGPLELPGHVTRHVLAQAVETIDEHVGHVRRVTVHEVVPRDDEAELGAVPAAVGGGHVVVGAGAQQLHGGLGALRSLLEETTGDEVVHRAELEASLLIVEQLDGVIGVHVLPPKVGECDTQYFNIIL